MALQDDVNGQVAAIKGQFNGLAATQQVSFAGVKAALTAVANAVDGLGGDSSGLRVSIAEIADTQDVSFAGVKDGANNLIDMLIDKSNFSGADQ